MSAVPLLLAVVVASVLHVSLGWIWGPYAVGHTLVPYEETTELPRTTFVSAAVTLLSVLVLPVIAVPRRVAFSRTAIAITGMFAARFLVGSRQDAKSGATVVATRALALGAGSGGLVLAQSRVRDPQSGLWPVALIDDDPRKSRLQFSGVRVRAATRDISAVAERYDATVRTPAVSIASAETVREVSVTAREAAPEVLIVPAVSDPLFGRPTASDLRNLNASDLLGRQPVEVDVAAIPDQISGPRMLITGAGGAIGSGVRRQSRRFGPSRLLMLDRDERSSASWKRSLRSVSSARSRGRQVRDRGCAPVNISDGISFGEGSMIGTRAAVLQQIGIGAHATVGGSARVVHDVAYFVTAKGVLAR